MEYAYERVLNGTDLFDCLERASNDLRQQGYGIVTQLEVADALSKKFGVKFSNYQILGACNSEMGRRMYGIDKPAYGFQSSNVLVHADEKDVRLAIVRAVPMITIFSARDFGERTIPTETLRSVFDRLH